MHIECSHYARKLHQANIGLHSCLTVKDDGVDACPLLEEGAGSSEDKLGSVFPGQDGLPRVFNLYRTDCKVKDPLLTAVRMLKITNHEQGSPVQSSYRF